jgi:hypothetical protein
MQSLNDSWRGSGGQQVEESGFNCGEIMEIGSSGFQRLWIAVDLSETTVNQ